MKARFVDCKRLSYGFGLIGAGWMIEIREVVIHEVARDNKLRKGRSHRHVSNARRDIVKMTPLI